MALLYGAHDEGANFGVSSHFFRRNDEVISQLALPRIDMLCDRIDFTTAKQAQSVARLYGRCGVLSEIYGVTNSTFIFEGHKGSGDWQAVSGVIVHYDFKLPIECRQRIAL